MKKIFFVFVVTLLFVSCSSKKTPSEYFPMKVGMIWEYSLKLTNGSATNTGKMTHNIMDTIMVGNNKYYRFKTVFSGGQMNNESLEYYKETADGIVIGQPDANGKKELVIIPAIIEVGKEWEMPVQNGMRKYKLSAFEDVTIADKTYYDCIKVDYDETIGDRKNSGFFYFGKNTGLVRFFVKNDMGSGVFSTTEANLTSFTQ